MSEHPARRAARERSTGMGRATAPTVPAERAKFFAQVPRLFFTAQRPVHDDYQALLYQVAHAFQPRHLAMVERAFGLPHPAWTEADQRAAIATMDAMRYPDAAAFARLPDVEGLTLRHVSHYMHFFHHAYPMMGPESVAGLERAGLPLPQGPQACDLPATSHEAIAAYGAYIANIEVLKEGAPFWSVPETNVYLTRIVQGALHAYGQE